jgi:hypothetical protein
MIVFEKGTLPPDGSVVLSERLASLRGIRASTLPGQSHNGFTQQDASLVTRVTVSRPEALMDSQRLLFMVNPTPTVVHRKMGFKL